MANVNVVMGDIAQVESDALITAINSGGMWFGGIDSVIMRAAGNLFHSQAEAEMPLHDGQTVVAKSNGKNHGAAFENVVFVIDDLKKPLRSVIFCGLQAAHEAGFRRVTLPTIRMGVMLGAVEKDTIETIDEMIKGVEIFQPIFLEEITFVVYNDIETYELLKKRLAVMK